MDYGGPQIFLMICGVLGIVTLLFNLFLFIGDAPGDRSTTSTPSIDSDDFLLALSHVVNVPFEFGDRVTILNNGDEFFPLLYEALESAKRSINFSTYIWEPGEVSDRLFDIFIRQAKAGVGVRVLLDGFGGMKASEEKIRELRAAGGSVAQFRPPRLGKLTRFNCRNHRRAIVIDGVIGFTGGMAVGDKWLGSGQAPEEWRDMMFKVTGSMAQSLQGVFAQLWASTAGEILSGKEFYPALSLGNSGAKYISVASSPADDAQPLPVLYWFTISCAQKKLYIASPYAVPGKHIREAIVERAKAGVDVRLLLPNHLTDAHPVRLASHSYYSMFLEAGVRIYEFQPARLHSKVLVADGQWSVIGSANMDLRSEIRNEENVLGISDPDLAGRLEQVFLEDLKNAHEITAEKWRDRSIFNRLFEWLFRAFIKQY